MVGLINIAILTLEDGTTYTGKGFGVSSEISGEIVFNTGMVGYPEALTDPSYRGQILISTYPLIGNYGIPPKISDQFHVPISFQSQEIQVTGFGVHRLSKKPSHWNNEKTLDKWFLEEDKTGIEGIDTRALTKKLRKKGVMLGIIKNFDESERVDVEYYQEKVKEIEDPNNRNLVKEVTVERPVFYLGPNSPKVVVIDCGVKMDILRNLVKRGMDVIRVPYDYSTEQILSHEPSGVLISNGPGDPKKCKKTIKTVSELLEMNVPTMGICLGNQILALAAGADTYKLKFGHRGQNHPSMDIKSKNCFITSQNHGYAIDEKSLKNTKFKTSFVNLNDKTVEGIVHKSKDIFGIQFHPEANPGPCETDYLFDKFIEKVRKYEN
jgi:carbamoyl-phosphate synthase small subunit